MAFQKQNTLNISLIVPVRNDSEYLIHILKSIKTQTLLPNEIIIIDSSSNHRIKEYLKLNTHEIPIIYHYEDKAYPGKARNLGVQYSNNNWVAFLDSKTIPQNNWLERYLYLIKAYDSDAVFGVTKFQAKNAFQKLLRAATYGTIGHHTVPGTLIKKSVFNETGAFIENVRMAEDIEWRKRLKDKGIKIHRPNEPVLNYSGLPKNYFLTLKKYIISSYHTARVNIQKNVKDAYLTFVLILSAIIIPKWNYLIKGWDTNPLYIPNVTKIYLLSIIAILLIIQGFRWLFTKKSFETFFSRSLKILIFIFVTLGVYRWNAVIASWMEDTVLYMPHISKIYVGTVIIGSILYRGVIQPLKREVSKSYIFPYNWLKIGILGLSLDIVKAPGYIIGAIVGIARK